MISLDISKCYGFEKHRSGWNYAIGALMPHHSLSGVRVDGFVEHSFSWHVEEYLYGLNSRNIPYTRPWIGFFHNPPSIPSWFDAYNSPQAMFNRDVFRQSLKSCIAIVTLSDYLKEWISKECDNNIISVKHPTGTNIPKWDVDKFLNAENPTVLQIGYWLRNLESISKLKTPYPFKKLWLPSDREYAQQILDVYRKTNKDFYEDKQNWGSVEVLDWIEHSDYDELLTSGVVFLDLYDSSANNAVIECIARNTPLLVNRLPAVVEYCGEDYPLYFDDLDHASRLLCDTDKIIEAHLHFKNMDRRWLGGSYFAADVQRKLKEVLQ